MSERVRIRTEEQALLLYSDSDGREVHLRSSQSNTSIEEAKSLVLRGAWWDSQDAAREAGLQYRDALIYALAAARIGGDLGDRAPKSFFTSQGLAMMEAEIGRRALNDVHGLMVFVTEPPPVFVDQHGTGRRGVPLERFTHAFEEGARAGYGVNDRCSLALEFFTASFFTNYADSRFLLLFMAAEALIVQEPRSEEVIALVERFEDTLKDNDTVEVEARRSLEGSMKWLKVESIRQAGRRLARELANDDYSGTSGEDLFLKAYDLRNGLVHGHTPAPTREEVGSVAASLEVLVSDLISGRIQRDGVVEGGNSR